MNRKSKKSNFNIGLVCAATVLSGIPVFSMAQESQVTAIEEVLVTARRRAENLQDVPVAVSAFSAEALEQSGISDITQLQQRLPNTTLQVSRATNSTLTAYIRGIGQQDPLWGFEPGVGIYVDDVYIARPQGAVLEILDVERIEVLRGPQGTLYGKNTIGGAVKYQTRRLGNEPTLNIKGSAGDYNKQELAISGSMPLIENKLYIGGGIATLKRDGFGEFRNTGDDNYNKDLQTAHVKLEWAASDDVLVSLSADRTEDDSNPRGGYRLTPSLLTGQQPYNSVFDSDTSQPNLNEVVTEGMSAQLAWQMNDNWEFKSITAKREGSTFVFIDFDATRINSFDVPGLYEDEQFTQEFQLNYSADQLNVVSGLYYYQGDACGAFGVVLGRAGITLENGGCVDTESYSAFAQASYDFSDAFSMSFGGRYTTDEKAADVYRFIYLGTKNPKQTGTPVATQSDFKGDESWSEFSPHIGAQYRFNDDVMGYVSYTSGFKSGGFDMRANAAVNPAAHDPFNPEIVDSFEVGVKSTLMNSRLRLNAAAFFNDYQDMQVTVQRAVGTTDFASQVINAGQSEMRGFEVEALAALTDRLSLSAVVGYIDAEFVELETFNPATGTIIDVADLWVISNTPEWSSNLALSYVADIGGWQSRWAVDASYRGETHIFELPSRLDQSSYSLVNANIVLTSPDQHWTVGLHVKNLTDKEYRIAGYNFPASFDANGNVLVPGLGGDDTVTGFYGDPRTVTLSVGYRF